jgi:hypothetical protein
VAIPLLRRLKAHSLQRTALLLKRRAEADDDQEAAALTRFHLWYERAVIESMERFFPIPAEVKVQAEEFLSSLRALVGPLAASAPPQGDAVTIFRRTSLIKGPLSAFGHDYLTDRLGEDRARSLRLLRFRGRRGSGAEYAYEVLNFVDGRRTVQEIRDAVTAIYGPIPLDIVREYLQALAEIGVIESVRQ